MTTEKLRYTPEELVIMLGRHISRFQVVVHDAKMEIWTERITLNKAAINFLATLHTDKWFVAVVDGTLSIKEL